MQAITSRERRPDDAYSWFRLVVTMALAAVTGVGMWSMVVALPAIQADFGTARADATLPFTLTMFGFGLGSVVVGRLLDRFGVTLPVAFSCISLASGYMLAALSSSIWVLSLTQVLVGFGAAAGFGPMLADISHWFDKRRGIAVAMAATGNYFAGAIWPIFIEMLISSHGWRIAFVTIGVVCLVTSLPLVWLLRERPPASYHAIAQKAQVQSPFSVGTLQLILCIAGVACCVAMAMPQVHIVAYCIDLGHGFSSGAEMLSLMLFGGILSRLFFGLMADKFGGVKTLLLSSVMQGISLLLYLPFDGLASLYIVSLVFGLSQGGIVPAYAIIIREYMPAQEAGRRIGTVLTATVVGMALGGWMSGWIYDLTGSYQAAFLNGIAWNLLNVSMMTLILMRSRKRMALA